MDEEKILYPKQLGFWIWLVPHNDWKSLNSTSCTCHYIAKKEVIKVVV